MLVDYFSIGHLIGTVPLLKRLILLQGHPIVHSRLVQLGLSRPYLDPRRIDTKYALTAGVDPGPTLRTRHHRPIHFL